MQANEKPKTISEWQHGSEVSDQKISDYQNLIPCLCRHCNFYVLGFVKLRSILQNRIGLEITVKVWFFIEFFIESVLLDVNCKQTRVLTHQTISIKWLHRKTRARKILIVRSNSIAFLELNSQSLAIFLGSIWLHNLDNIDLGRYGKKINLIFIFIETSFKT